MIVNVENVIKDKRMETLVDMGYINGVEILTHCIVYSITFAHHDCFFNNNPLRVKTDETSETENRSECNQRTPIFIVPFR